jgi:hypothetical protein
LITAVTEGAVAVSTAAQIVSLPRAKQAKAVANGKRAVSKAAFRLRDKQRREEEDRMRDKPGNAHANTLQKRRTSLEHSLSSTITELECLSDLSLDEFELVKRLVQVCEKALAQQVDQPAAPMAAAA